MCLCVGSDEGWLMELPRGLAHPLRKVRLRPLREEPCSSLLEEDQEFGRWAGWQGGGFSRSVEECGRSEGLDPAT